MRKHICAILFTIIFYHSNSQVAINTFGNPPNSSAMLDITSTTKGLLIPRMTTAQRTAISSPSQSLLVFDTDTQSFWYRIVSGWVEIQPSLPTGTIVGSASYNNNGLISKGYNFYGKINGITSYSTNSSAYPAGSWLPTYVEGDPIKQSAPFISALKTPIVWTGTRMLIIFEYAVFQYDPVANTWSSSSIPVAYQNLFGRKAIWTGTEMIIWGGMFTGTNNGIRYNPGTNTFTAINTVNQPTPRINFSCVWTGSKMFIWGGENASSTLSDGAVYDPAADAWTPIPAAGAPTVRRNHTAVSTGSRVVVWGGSSTQFSSAGQQLNTGAQYNPVTNTWTAATAIANAPTARHLHTAVWTGTEMIVWGGADGSAVQTGAKYNPTSDTWAPTTITNSPNARTYHTAEWTGTKMLVAGGQWGGFSGGSLDSHLYDPFSDAWTSAGNFSNVESKFDHLSLNAGNMIIIFGGVDNNFIYPPTGYRYLLSGTTTSATTTSTGQTMYLYRKN